LVFNHPNFTILLSGLIVLGLELIDPQIAALETDYIVVAVQNYTIKMLPDLIDVDIAPRLVFSFVVDFVEQLVADLIIVVEGCV
jgi:hypothetical protein